MSWDELEALCRRERLYCGRLGLKRNNANEFEVEFLCNYKRKKVKLHLLQRHSNVSTVSGPPRA